MRDGHLSYHRKLALAVVEPKIKPAPGLRALYAYIFLSFSRKLVANWLIHHFISHSVHLVDHLENILRLITPPVEQIIAVKILLDALVIEPLPGSSSSPLGLQDLEPLDLSLRQRSSA